MRKYRFVLALDVPENSLHAAYKKLQKFLSLLPAGLEAQLTEEAYWPSGSKVPESVMKSTHQNWERKEKKER